MRFCPIKQNSSSQLRRGLLTKIGFKSPEERLNLINSIFPKGIWLATLQHFQAWWRALRCLRIRATEDFLYLTSFEHAVSSFTNYVTGSNFPVLLLLLPKKKESKDSPISGKDSLSSCYRLQVKET